MFWQIFVIRWLYLCESLQVKVKQPSSRVSSSPVVGLRASPTTVPVRKLELMEGLQSLHDEDGEGDADEKRILVAPSPVGLSPFVHSEPTQGPHFLCTAFVPDSRTGSTLSFTDPEVIEKYGHMYTTSSWTQFKASRHSPICLQVVCCSIGLLLTRSPCLAELLWEIVDPDDGKQEILLRSDHPNDCSGPDNRLPVLGDAGCKVPSQAG